jgi:hypothetical protein
VTAPNATRRILVHELIALLDKAGPRIESQADEISTCFGEILKLPGLDTAPASPAGAGTVGAASVGWLYQDGDVRITRGLLPAGFTQTPHNHGAWNIFGIYRGAVKYTSYRRMDDRSVPYVAELQVAEDRVMTDGDLTLLPGPPHDIHAVTGLAEQTVTLLVARGEFAPVRECYLPDQGCYVLRKGDGGGQQLWPSTEPDARAAGR